MNLLIVNDEEVTAETMKADINWNEYSISKVYTAYDVDMAKDKINKVDINIILCDIEMPGESGIELLRWVRKEELAIEVIFLTCHAKFAYAKEAISLKCQDYILLPAKYENIGITVNKVANRIITSQKEERYREYGKKYIDDKIDTEMKDQEYNNSEELIEIVIKYINENLSDTDLSVNKVAEKYYVHPVYLNRVFKKIKEISIGQYIINEKMKLAASLLENKSIYIKSVATMVGYKSYSNFNLMFKKYYKCSPSEYREKL